MAENKNQQRGWSAYRKGKYCKIYKIPLLRWCGHVARIKNQRIPKQISTPIMEGTRKIGRPRKIWRDKVEGNLKIMGIKNSQAIARDRWEWRKIVLEAKVHGGL